MNGPTRILLVYVALSTCILSAAEPPVLDGEPDASFSVHWLNEASTYVVLCARSGDDSWAKVADRLAEVRKARAVVTFDENQPQDLLPLMRKLAPENVAYVIPPRSITPHVCGQLAELSSRIHADNKIDYASGYITGVTSKDALKLIDRTIAREKLETPIPHVCTGIGHSWKQETRRPFIALRSREYGNGPVLKLIDHTDKTTTVDAVADTTLMDALPDKNCGDSFGMTVAPGIGTRSLIRFDPREIGDVSQWKIAILEVPVRGKLVSCQQMMIAACPIEKPWGEMTVTAKNAPKFHKAQTAT